MKVSDLNKEDRLRRELQKSLTDVFGLPSDNPKCKKGHRYKPNRVTDKTGVKIKWICENCNREAK